MHLTYRPATVVDIETCLALLPGFSCPSSRRAEFPAAWQRWLLTGEMEMTILEDVVRPPESRQIAFGSSVFVTDSFLAEAKTTLPPSISAQVVDRWRKGCSPILSPNQVRSANTGPGLNLLILHLGWADGLVTEEVRLVKAKMLEGLLFFFRGYKLKEVVQEVYSEEERQRAEAAGALTKNDYSDFYRQQPDALLSPAQRPYLVGTHRDEVQDGCYLSPLFLYQPPRFFFKAGEQDVLRLALLDKDDAETAQFLSISASAVQKRWKAIYEKAETALPNLFPADDRLPAARTRGTEKRRFLLSYLRAHPEELRPVVLPGKS